MIKEIKDALRVMYEARQRAMQLVKSTLPEGTEVVYYDKIGNRCRGVIEAHKDNFGIVVKGSYKRQGGPRTLHLKVDDLIDTSEENT